MQIEQEAIMTPATENLSALLFPQEIREFIILGENKLTLFS